MKIPRGTHPTGPDAANDIDIPAPRVPWVAADPMGIGGAESLYAHLVARQAATGYAGFDRMALDDGPMVERARCRRRRYKRSALIGALLGTLLAGSVWYSAHGQELGPLPDPVLTPGAVASTDVAEVCAWQNGMSYSQRHRLWNRKAETLAKYGVPASERPNYEDDDRVPVCAGGDNLSPLNHWLMPWPQARIKDELESALCRAVCSRRMTLNEAQQIFLGDWRAHLAQINRRRP